MPFSLVTLDFKEIFLSWYLLFSRHYMRMHSLCLICVNNGWLSTCSLLLEKITAKKIWFWANFQNNEVSVAIVQGKWIAPRFWRCHLLKIDNSWDVENKGWFTFIGFCSSHLYGSVALLYLLCGIVEAAFKSSLNHFGLAPFYG